MEISNVPLFKGLNQNEIDRIKGIITLRAYPKGATVFVEGQETDGLYIVNSGLVKVTKLHKDGREKTLAILSDGDTLGEMTLFGSDLRSATLETLEKTTLMVIRRDNFRDLMAEIPGLFVRIIEILSRRLRESNRQIEELTFFNARSRVICNLIHLAKERGKIDQGGIKISLKLTHAEFANLIGVSRETVTKVLSELQELSLIKISNRQIKILNIDKMYEQVI